ncbi:DeoR family transcriptional regulator [Noviherbaspirillum pedocola]|uniref:DeoR/GlpR transcriptional regulator n=1 Tax=Noviherbaspirillum pedocola TaxID=2801341 RepID=A0A934W899_9BURK|nr:DeoR/GlpR transcriptional regulator [Noviherbaspirillum pedocola]
MAMTKTEKRREVILDIVNKEATNAEALSRRFGVSESSIRRDLAELANDGCIVRTYGAAAPSPALLPHLAVNQRVALDLDPDLFDEQAAHRRPIPPVRCSRIFCEHLLHFPVVAHAFLFRQPRSRACRRLCHR